MFGKKPKTEALNIDEIHDMPGLTPKRDETLLAQMDQAMRGKLPVYYAAVPIALLVPFDIEYRPDLHPIGKLAIGQAFDEAKKNVLQKLLVYPRGLWFVVSDDYIPLFAAIYGLPDYVPCYVLGKPNNPHVTDIQGPIQQQDIAKVFGLQ